MLPNPVEYHPYTSYHVSETLQVLLFTAVGFLPPDQEAGPRGDDQPRPRLVLSEGRPRFPLAGAQTAPGPRHRRGRGCTGRGRSDAADGVRARPPGLVRQRVIDGAVDGVAMAVRGMGRRLRLTQRGRLQENLACSPWEPARWPLLGL